MKPRFLIKQMNKMLKTITTIKAFLYTRPNRKYLTKNKMQYISNNEIIKLINLLLIEIFTFSVSANILPIKIPNPILTKALVNPKLTMPHTVSLPNPPLQ